MDKTQRFIVGVLISLLTFMAGSFFGADYNTKQLMPAFKHDVEVGTRTGFVIGCRAAFGATLHLQEGDVLEPMYYEWCVKNAMAFDPKVTAKGE